MPKRMAADLIVRWPVNMDIYLQYFTDNNFGHLITGHLTRGGWSIGAFLAGVPLCLSDRVSVK